jgi:hypothetical protein
MKADQHHQKSVTVGRHATPWPGLALTCAVVPSARETEEFLGGHTVKSCGQRWRETLLVGAHKIAPPPH